jgi:putative ABC transport system substrate-binding protein
MEVAMKRRRLLLAAGALAALPRLVGAQARPARIGWVTAQRPPSLVPYVDAFRKSLAEFGFVEGRNLTIEFRYGDDDLGRVRGLADELIRLPIDLLVAQGAAVVEVRAMKPPVPVVYAFSGDPVIAGLCESLARPSGNMTGVTFLATEMNGKRLELMREMVPGIRRVTLLANPEHPGEAGERANSEAGAKRIGLDATYVAVRTTDELNAAFVKIAADRSQGISLFSDGFAVQNRDAIIAFAMRQRIPLVSGWPVFANSGALCSYGPRLVDSYRRVAYLADRVLRGAKPADLPIEQPTTIETVVNLKTADALGLTIPQSVLVRADQLIR